MQPAANKTQGKPIESDKKAMQYARLALPMMAQHSVDPTPENYAVWYHYVMASNKELVKEIDHVIAQQLPFSADINRYMYNKYIMPFSGQQALDDATSGTQALMEEVLNIISEFSGETNTYHKQMDDHVQQLSNDQFKAQPMQEMVKEILTRAKAIRDSGSQMQTKLTESKNEIESLKKNLDQIATESKKDFLTGVYNRKTLDNFLEEQVGVARQNKSDLCLLMVDIDHFKQFNDRFGHLIGDEVLKTVAKSLIEAVRGKDMVARFGGEEFAVVLLNTPLAGALIVAETLRKSISSSDLVRKDTGATVGSITVSIGVARMRVESDTIPTLIARADDALYRSKKAGRNRVTPEAQ